MRGCSSQLSWFICVIGLYAKERFQCAAERGREPQKGRPQLTVSIEGLPPNTLPQQLHIAHWNHMQTRHFACVRLFILLR